MKGKMKQRISKGRELLRGITQPGHILLLLMVVCSGFTVVFSNFQSRQLFHELQTLQQDVGSLQLEWRQLLVEEGAFSSHLLVEREATEELGMTVPDSNNTVAVILR